MRSTLAAVFAVFAVLVVSFWTAYSHSHVEAVFDAERIVEIDGRLTEVSWRYPRIRLTVQSTDAERTVWEVESRSNPIVARLDTFREMLKVGEPIRLAGNPARQAPHEIFALHVMTPSGEEIVLDPRLQPYWGE